MPIPDVQSLMLPVLKRAAQGETRVPEIEEKIATEFNLTPDERDQMLPSGRQKILRNRIHWAKTYMLKAGLIDQSRRGWFEASEAGLALLARNPGRIDVKVLEEYPGFKDFRGYGDGSVAENGEIAAIAPLPASAASPEEQIEAIHLAAQTALRNDLVQRILQNSPAPAGLNDLLSAPADLNAFMASLLVIATVVFKWETPPDVAPAAQKP